MRQFITIILIALISFTVQSQSLLLDVDGKGHIKDALGIGVTDPSNKLHIGATHASGITIQQLLGNFQQLRWLDNGGTLTGAIVLNNPVSGNDEMRFYMGGHDRLFLNQNGNLRLGGLGAVATQHVNFSVNGNLAIGESFDESTPPTNGAIIEGRVGIGTTTPSTEDELHVYDAGNRSRITSQTSTNLSAGFRSKTSQAEIFAGAQASRYSIYNNLNGTEQFTILKEGNTGVGTINPIQKLHVAGGNAMISPSGTSGNSELHIAGSVDGNYGSILRYNNNNTQLEFYTKSNNVMSVPLVTMHSSGSRFKGKSDGAHVMTVENTSATTTASGIEVKLGVSGISTGNNYVTFKTNSGTIGKIHGQITLQSLSRDLINDLLGDSPVEDDPASGSLDRDQNPDDVDHGILEFIQTEYAQGLLFMTIEFLDAVIMLIANSFSVFDPDDIAASTYHLVMEGIKLAIYVTIEELTSGIAYESGGADYAEWLPVANPKELFLPGDVVGVKGGLISKEYVSAENFMVVSHNPLVIGNMPPASETEDFEKIAFLGQVPVKTLGPVRIGDYILPSGNGDGFGIAVNKENMKAKDYGRIIGIAWSESEDDKIINMINTAVGINSNDMATTIDQMQQLLNSVQKSLKEVNPNFEMNLFDTDENHNVQQDMVQYTSADNLEDIVENRIELSEYSNMSESEQRLQIFEDTKAQLLAQGLDFSLFPKLEDFLSDPTKEKAEQLLDRYTSALAKCQTILGGK